MKEKRKQHFTKYVIIGLGRFGQALARELALKSKCEIMAIDKNEDALNAVKEHVTHCVIADATDEKAMMAIGIKNFDVAVVCIADDMESSILVSLLCKQFGIEYVVAKAKSERHKVVLEKLGLDLVIVPEFEMGRKLALRLLNPVASAVFDLGGNISIVEIFVPKAWDGKSMMEIDLRKKYRVNALLLKRNDELIANVAGDTIVLENDSMVIAGAIEDLDKLAANISR